ncbi:Cro/C1-type HTH DNA-binding domain-containing protein [Lachnospiraceae bacterium YSD2013]|nr:Cro/C1-type HTH DNA-binding domain-containing protein [Lachnospiraceae bacterium YSD2013]
MNRRTIIDMEATSINLVRLMKEKGFSAKKMQESLGCENVQNVQTIYKWCNPRVKNIPSLDNLILLARLFECHVEDIVVVKEVGIREKTEET